MLCRGELGGGGATGLLNKGGGEQQASWFSKQQAVEFPQVLTSNYKICLSIATKMQQLVCDLKPHWYRTLGIEAMLHSCQILLVKFV